VGTVHKLRQEQFSAEVEPQGRIKAAKPTKQKPHQGGNPPRRVPNKERRPREHLFPNEVEAMVRACRFHKRGHPVAHIARDQLLITLMFHHGLRRTEACDLRWSQIDLERAQIHVERLKGSDSGVHPMDGTEIRLARAWRRAQGGDNSFVFTRVDGAPITGSGLYAVIANAGRRAKLDFPVHPHNLRHASGFHVLEGSGNLRLVQQWLGHRNIASTTVYAALSAKAFEKIRW